MTTDHAEPLIINLAPTGMMPTKQMTPHVPISTQEIVDDAARCAALGATIIHLHARDELGRPTTRPEYMAPLVEGIRTIDPALVVCVTCSGRFATGLDDRAAVLDLTGRAKPDMASLTLGSNNFVQQASVNAPDTIRGLAERMRARGIKPELEVFEPGMLTFGQHLADKGLLDGPWYVNVLLGNLGTSPATPGALGAFLALLPAGATFAVAGIGRYQAAATMLGIAAGGHVRVGLEDNIWWDRRRTTLATNAALVGRVRQMAEAAERPIATPAETRARLGLAPHAPHAPPRPAGDYTPRLERVAAGRTTA
jgi:3-keto-5-aminohexanoate cleavage enzyme